MPRPDVVPAADFCQLSWTGNSRINLENAVWTQGELR
jgi:hypothetical protein